MNIGAVVVIVLAGMVVPITLLLMALVFDLLMVLWVLFEYGHDHWALQFLRVARRSMAKLHVIPVPHGHAPKPVR